MGSHPPPSWRLNGKGLPRKVRHSSGALVFAAAARACDQQDADATNSLNTGGPAATRDWGSLANHFRSRYEERVRPRRGVRRKRLYSPAEPTPTQNTDPGP